MPTVRELMLARAKVPAKVFDLERPAEAPRDRQQQPSLLRSASEQSATKSAVPRPPTEQSLAEASGAASAAPISARPPLPKPAPGSGGSGRPQPQKASEARKPRSASAQAGRAPSEPPRSRQQRGASPSTSNEGDTSVRSAPNKARASSLSRARIGDAAPPLDRKDVGKIPTYLKKRQEELQEQKRAAARPTSPQPPPGHRKVGDDERQLTIGELKKRRAEVEKAQNSLPFKIETAGQKQREKDLADRITHIDKLLTLFSKPIVFVPQDAGPIVPPPPPAAAAPQGGGGVKFDDDDDTLSRVVASQIAPRGPCSGSTGISSGDGASTRVSSHEPWSDRCLASKLQVGPSPTKVNFKTEVKVVAPPGGISSLQLY